MDPVDTEAEMSEKLTAEQLNTLSKEALVSMTLSMQEQLNELSSRLDYLTGQIIRLDGGMI